MIEAKLFDSSNQPLIIRGGRNVSGTIASNGGEVILQVNGDESCIIQAIITGGTVSLTLAFFGSMDGGVNYFPIQGMPIHAIGGTAPNYAQRYTAESFAAGATRFWALPCGQLTHISVRATAWSNGAAAIVIRSDDAASIHPGVSLGTSSPLVATNTAAVSLTLTIPAVAGQRHFLDNITITRSASTAITAAASPSVITTTNLPGALAFTMGTDAAAIGVDKTIVQDFGGGGLAATALGAQTTIVCPAVTGAIWRVTSVYRLGY